MEMTWKQVCDAAGLNESTGRFYKDKFKKYFSYTGVGRHKKYSSEAIEQLQLIAQLYGKGLDASQVMSVLEEKYGVPIAQDESSSTYAVYKQENSSDSYTYAVQQEEFIAAIKQVFQEELDKRDACILQLQEELRSMKETLSGMEQKAIESTRSAADRDRSLMEEIRKIQVAQQQNSSPWWKKLLGK